MAKRTMDHRGKWIFEIRNFMGWFIGMKELQVYNSARGQRMMLADW